jgi:hypothetical protein
MVPQSARHRDVGFRGMTQGIQPRSSSYQIQHQAQSKTLKSRNASLSAGEPSQKDLERRRCFQETVELGVRRLGWLAGDKISDTKRLPGIDIWSQPANLRVMK